LHQLEKQIATLKWDWVTYTEERRIDEDMQ